MEQAYPERRDKHNQWITAHEANGILICQYVGLLNGACEAQIQFGTNNTTHKHNMKVVVVCRKQNDQEQKIRRHTYETEQVYYNISNVMESENNTRPRELLIRM